jgi:hypothetical protein
MLWPPYLRSCQVRADAGADADGRIDRSQGSCQVHAVTHVTLGQTGRRTDTLALTRRAQTDRPLERRWACQRCMRHGER